MRPMIDADEMLKQMTAQAVSQGESLRSTVRDLTLQALQSRELSLAQIKSVVGSVAEGVNLGAIQGQLDTDKVFSQALAGMDDALLKVVEASRIALHQITGEREFRDSKLKKSLDDLERLEDEFLATVKKATSGAGAPFKSQWSGALQESMSAGTATGAQVVAMMDQYGDQVRKAARAQRDAGFRAVHALAQNFATLASGVLIGLTEAMQQGAGKPAAPSTARKRR
ncbi:MAG: hypothetical protein JSW31_02445 [Burkholderiales bacterium]|nr:MAG: hypothetical protein JSW31_02445 [Burkholderiales bacterium]